METPAIIEQPARQATASAPVTGLLYEPMARPEHWCARDGNRVCPVLRLRQLRFAVDDVPAVCRRLMPEAAERCFDTLIIQRGRNEAMKIGGCSIVLVLCALLSTPSIAEQPADGQVEKRPRLELSLRSWMFTNGETRWSHNASGLDAALGNPTSNLTYKDTNTHLMELGAKINLSRRWYLRADLGFSVDFGRGTLIDDDYLAGQQLFSRTSSSISGNGTWYVNGDVGYRAVEFRNGRGHVDVFGGFQYWKTTYEATGFQRLVCDSGVTTCMPPSSTALAITNTTHWITPVRVGFDTEYYFTRRLSLDFRASVSPVSVLYNEDVHHLRSDLRQDPSFSMWGVGASVNSDIMLKVMLTRSLALTGGYRVFWNRTFTGTWETHPLGAGSQSAPLTEFETLRHGATIGLTALF